jgi:peptidoglycan/LPS O-acetylase OafA/YrhL
MIRLGDVAAGRDNNVRLLRHLAALAVILFHCYALKARWGDDPLFRLSRHADLGSVGVQLFFALSGYLVTQSWCQHPSVRAFVTARFLRIYPALVVATIFTVAIAGVASRLAYADYLADPRTWTYFWQTATGYDSNNLLPEAFVTNPFPRAANGSLWTLPVEIRLYVGVLLVGLAGILTRRVVAVAVAIGAVLALVYVPWPVSLVLQNVSIRSLAVIFVCGALAYVLRAYVRLSIVAAIAALALYLALPFGMTRAVATLPLIVYMTLVAAYHPRLRIERLARGPDFSYGLYVYAFPVQQLFLWRWPGIGVAPLFVAATPVIAVAATLSWYGIERPALALKSRLQRSTPPAAPLPADPHARAS